MVEYIYFVKCPDCCEDEHFDFFDEAKGYAMSRLGQKPIITQTEVNRNDFGECTDHCDLGTIWSWEDVVGKDFVAEPVEQVLSKDNLKDYDPDNDPEFDDNDFYANNELIEDYARRISFNNKEDRAEFSKLCSEIEIITGEDLDRFMVDHKADDSNLLDKLRAYRDELGADFKLKESTEEHDSLATNKRGDYLTRVSAGNYAVFNRNNVWLGTIKSETNDEAIERFNRNKLDEARKPIPEGMTIEQLVEEMEENEDAVECTWCNDLFDKSECRKEVDLGWLCSRCEAAIKSRGEPLTFRENNYWDFLDEKLDIDFSNCIDSSDMEIWGIEPVGESTYKAVLLKRYEDVPFRGAGYRDEIDRIENQELFDLGGLFVFHFGKDGLPALGRWDPELLNSLGTCEIIFDDERYDQACERVLNHPTPKLEEVDPEAVHDLGNEYDGGYPEELPEIDEVSDSHLSICPECGKESFDEETGICIECGFH